MVMVWTFSDILNSGGTHIKKISIMVNNNVISFSASCQSGQCYLNSSRLDPHVTCNENRFGSTSGQCFETWSSLSSCVCNGNNTYRISSSGASYWCNNGNWDSALYDLKCLGEIFFTFNDFPQIFVRTVGYVDIC